MIKRIAFTAALLLVAAVALASDQPKGKLTRVEAKKVCMVNEQNMAKDQIPVEVEGRTYYGCCEMCKKALADNADKRTAVDPVSGKKVDKAKAVIGAQEDGRVFYFENEENLAKWNAKADITVAK
jgi:YHS domain-containing protein